MPIFDYKCSSCSNRVSDEYVRRPDDVVICPACMMPMEKLASFPAVHVFPVGGVFLKHVSPQGKTFYSKKEMQQYAKNHDLELGALL